MPEGDTVHTLARTLGPELEGAGVKRLRLRDRGTLDAARGRRIERIEARGKHLLVHLEGAVVLHTHLGMNGAWHRYRRGERWRRGRAAASVELEAAGRVLVCFGASRAELLRTRELPMHPVLSRLGPDLLGEDADLDAVVERAAVRAAPQDASGLLLDQTVAAGIGNVYKSELLFLEGVSPRRPAAELVDAELRALYAQARRLLADNVARFPRNTVRLRSGARVEPLGPAAAAMARPRPPQRRGREAPLWVYERGREPCPRCGARLRRAAQGTQRRPTFWCPTCQGPAAAR